MTNADTRSMVIASDYRVPDPSRVPRLLEKRIPALAEIGAHHVIVHASSTDKGRVLVSIVVQNREPIVDLLRSRVFFDWFDAVGVEDIPAVFAGELVDRIDIAGTEEPAAPAVVVAAMTSVHDVSELIEHVHSALDRFAAAGVLKTWIFQAFDDPREVMILSEIDSADNARRWIDHPDPAAEWMANAGMGAYPPLFVGKLLQTMRIDETS
jgi:heme-degrading monooxygenase HmoA